MNENTLKSQSEIFGHVFKIVELYTEHMNIYGDTGNSLILKKRFALHGLNAEIIEYNVGDEFPEDVDIIVAGGGQDSSQEIIVKDLGRLKGILQVRAKVGTPMLAICGMYQLFGKYFETHKGKRIIGLEIFDLYTKAKNKRLIGNIVTQSSRFGKLIGYENHSGQTFLGSTTEPLAEDIILGVGNNSQKKTEGAIMNNAIGTYLHGPFLSKNPSVADFLIQAAVSNFVGQKTTLTSKQVSDFDKITLKARDIAFNLTR